MNELHFKGEIRAVQLLICHFQSDLLSFVFRHGSKSDNSVLDFSIPSSSHLQQGWHISWRHPALLY